jgi:hypothetical protein
MLECRLENNLCDFVGGLRSGKLLRRFLHFGLKRRIAHEALDFRE